MDSLFMAFIGMVGLVSYVIVTIGRPAGFGLGLFSWIFAIPFLGFYVAQRIASTDSTSLMTWNGDVEIGLWPVIVSTIGVAIFLCGGRQWTNTKA